MQRRRISFLFLNLGHFLDHLFMLVFATVAALRLANEWGLSYAELVPYATPGFIAFGVGAVVAGWIADKWSREGMMVVFFIGIGVSSILAAAARNPIELAVGLTLIGIFAAIYHPVGLALVVHERVRTGLPIAINGIFGNMGVACAALLSGFLIDWWGWRGAFYLPGIFSILVGIAYLVFIRGGSEVDASPQDRAAAAAPAAPARTTNLLVRIFAIIFFTTAIGGLVFQSTTFALPKIFDERLAGIAASATLVGWYTFLVFSLAALAQLLVGYLVDRHSIRLVFSAVALLQAAFFFVMTHVDGFPALFVAFAFMFAVFGQIPINDVLVGRMARSHWRSRAYAMRYLVTFSVMASAVPMIGWVHGNWGFARFFEILGFAALAIFFAVLLLPRGAVALDPGGS